MTTETLERPAGPKIEMKAPPPSAAPSAVTRLSEAGEGIIIWGHMTHHTLETVLVPDYFRKTSRHGFQRHDEIKLTCRQYSAVATRATLIVVAARPGTAVEVKLLGEALHYDVGHRTAFEILGTKPSSSKGDMEKAYRARAAELDPDAPDHDADLAALNQAHDETLLIAAALQTD